VDQTYRIFTDGSAIGNPGPGGWGGQSRSVSNMQSSHRVLIAAESIEAKHAAGKIRQPVIS
jgi:ribonuclease HI